MIVLFMLKQRILGYDLRNCNETKFEVNERAIVSLSNIKKMNAESTLVRVSAQYEDFAASVIEDKSTEIVCRALLQKDVSEKMHAFLNNVTIHTFKGPTITTSDVSIDFTRSFEAFVTSDEKNVDKSLIAFCNEIKRELDDYAVRTFRILRWRTNASGPHNYVHGAEYRFSFDGTTWHVLPKSFGAFFDLHRFISLDEDKNKDIVKSVSNGQDEPLGHSLFREAWRLRGSSPKSSIIMGIAAAEIGLKDCISTLLPDTSWLLDNTPSSPIIQIITEYLPTLPIKVTIENKIPLPSKTIIESIKKGVSMRNRLVHSGRASLNHSTIGDILFSIEDLLWLLDFYKGYTWAFDYIRPKVKKEMLA